MINVCEKCGKKHIIHIDNMDICDNCMSTVVYDESDKVLSKHKTSDAFVEYYNSVRDSLTESSMMSEQICKKMVNLAPDIPTILNAYGICLINKGDNDNAIKYFKKAININPCFGSAYCNIAKAYYSTEDYAGMLQSLKHAEKYIFPEDDRYKDFLGDYACALAINGRVRNAEMILEKAEKYGYESGERIRSIINGAATTKSQSQEVPKRSVQDTKAVAEEKAMNSKAQSNSEKSIDLGEDPTKGKITPKKVIITIIIILVLAFIFIKPFRDMVISVVVFIGMCILGVLGLIFGNNENNKIELKDEHGRVVGYMDGKIEKDRNGKDYISVKSKK